MSIFTLLNQIKNDEIVLPGIQRDFVWEKHKILRLLDSIMRGYPIGIALFWETYENIQYRKFSSDHRSGTIHTFLRNTKRKRLRVVLDGQQRLQSLYVALYGTLAGKALFFDILSGKDTDDVADEKYIFDFMTDEEAKSRSKYSQERMNQQSIPDSARDRKYFIKVSDLYSMRAKEKKTLEKELTKSLNLFDEEQLRLEVNISRLDETFAKDDNLLKVSIIDEDIPSESEYRKSESDILEIFVRVNTEGTPLSRSDLIFSMLKLNWRESAEALPDFVRAINDGNSFCLDTDFVIRCLFAVSNLGTKFDIDLLRKRKNVDKLRENFKGCCDAIRSTIDFIQRECWCQSSQVIGGPATIVPFVYYSFHMPGHAFSNRDTVNIRKSLFLFGFAKPFSRYADSRLGAFIRDELQPLVQKHSTEFPFHKALWWVGYWERIKKYDLDLLNLNPILTLHVVQCLTGAKVQYVRNSPEIDHIFPRSILRRIGHDEALINHIANFWILAKEKNQNKSNRDPMEYFKDVDDTELEKALIDRTLLNYSSYQTFIATRSTLMLEKVRDKLQFMDEDFEKIYPKIQFQSINSVIGK